MALSITIKVVPSAGRQTCLIDKSRQIKCYLKSPPERGKANDELIAFLSKKLALPQTAIIIIQGASSRKKVIKINAPLTEQALYDQLGIAWQQPI